MKICSYILLFTVCVTPSLANNTSYIPQCVANDDCDADRVCAKQKCVNPCVAVCGANTVCHMSNHVAMCSCSPGHSGHPIIGCSPSPITIPVCPEPPRHKKFYVNSSFKTDWAGALTACVRNNSQLAAIDNSEELDEIRNLIRQTGLRRNVFWVSGTDHGNEGQFIWASTGRAITTPSDMWMPGEPNNIGEGGEQCVSIWERSSKPGYALNDVQCSYKAFLVCQYFVD